MELLIECPICKSRKIVIYGKKVLTKRFKPKNAMGAALLRRPLLTVSGSFFIYRPLLQVSPRGGLLCSDESYLRAHSRTGALPAIWLPDTPLGAEKLKLTSIYSSMKNITF